MDEKIDASPSRCKGGCGFFGGSSGYCSQCRVAHQAKDARVDSGRTVPAIEKQIDPKGFVDKPVDLPSTITTKKRKKSRKCCVCKKKLGLTGLTCRCGKLVCGLHRYPTEHQCSFDYKKMKIKELEASNPTIAADRVAGRL